MKHTHKLLIIALLLGFSSVSTYADCDACNAPTSLPPGTTCVPPNYIPPSGYMSEDVIVDDNSISSSQRIEISEPKASTKEAPKATSAKK